MSPIWVRKRLFRHYALTAFLARSGSDRGGRPSVRQRQNWSYKSRSKRSDGLSFLTAWLPEERASGRGRTFCPPDHRTIVRVIEGRSEEKRRTSSLHFDEKTASRRHRDHLSNFSTKKLLLPQKQQSRHESRRAVGGGRWETKMRTRQVSTRSLLLKS